MLEKMSDFFEKRLDGYDAHMLNGIDSAQTFYPFTARCLPDGHVLDLGCGTGLELAFYLARCPGARVTGIDLSRGMLNALEKKFPGRDLQLICGSYLDVPLPENTFDAAVSVESLHHFTREQKIPLYRKVRKSLKKGGFFILTDYFADTDGQEALFRREFITLKAAQGITDDAFYHYDTPLTVAHEMQALRSAGFTRVDELCSWGSTHTLKAM